MAHENYTQSDSVPASADLSASQYCGMVLDGNGNLALPAAGARIYGVLQNTPNALGRAGTVALSGITKMKLGASAIGAGTVLSVDASGRAIAQTSTNVVVGILKETGGGTNSIGSVELRLP